MTHNVGLWIDHKNAYVIWEGEKEVGVIPSNVEPRVHGGGTRIGGAYNHGLDSELRHNDRYENQLRDFYHKVVDTIRDANYIFIMGPGEAKTELEKEIRKHKVLAERLLKLEAADKMTDAQMVARVRAFFTKELAF